MNERAVAVLDQYDFQVGNTRKGRGMMIAETDKGVVSLSEYEGKPERLFLCKDICERMEAAGFAFVDTPIPGVEGNLYVTDAEGKNYVVKRYVEGRECNTADEKECRYMIGEIARMHKILEFGDNLPGNGSGEEQTPRIRDFSKREAEFRRVRSFIRKMPQKGEFEMAFLREYPYFQEVADRAAGFLEQECLSYLTGLVKERGMYCHGECNQHNILIGRNGAAVTHFEKCCMDIQVRDLYLFLRKILEKNNWSYTFGISILREYEKIKPLGAQEKKYLYARLLYPERFWKIANAYLNKRKSLPPRRQLDKLNSLLRIEEARIHFLEKLAKDLL